MVDDGSTDATAAVAAAPRDIERACCANPGNRGKGYAVRHGMLEAEGEWVLFTDADLSAPIEELETLWTAVQAAGASIAIGSRALNRSLIGVHQSSARENAGRVFNLLARQSPVLSSTTHNAASSSSGEPPRAKFFAAAAGRVRI